MRCTKAVIYSENLRNNLREIKKNLQKNVKLCLAVKANGYGNDAFTAAKIAEEMGAEYIAVATVSEGIELRKQEIKTSILLLSPCMPDEFSAIIENNITPLVFDEETIKEFASVVKNEKLSNYKVFLAVDTGMGRVGCFPEETGMIAKKIVATKSLELAGTITHFSVSDSISEENIKYTKEQYDNFIQAIRNIEKEGISAGIKTCCASAAAIAFPEFQMDMVRPGIILYGYYPDDISKEYLLSHNISLELNPVMQFESKVAAIKHFKKGMYVSYGRTWKANQDTDIAVLPVGYADGLLRRNSPGINVTINGRAYPIVGRICMDQCMVDIGLNNPNVKRWDTAIIFGPKNAIESCSLFDADDIARLTGTISYEIMTSISQRVPRVII